MKSACCLALVLGLAPMAAAQFTQFDWALDNPQGLYTFLSADSMSFDGLLGGFPDDFDAQFTALSPVDALVHVHVHTSPLDGECGSSKAFLGEAGQLVNVGDCNVDTTVNFTVHAGAEMVLGMHVIKGAFAGTVVYTQFIYRPWWMPLGGALGGTAGLPVLAGHGVLQAGEAFGVELDHAAPAAAAALVVGSTQANLPFKGGVLVPTPTIVVSGLVTDAAGALALDGTWPAGATGAFVLQAWIVDAGGPHGFAASNALSTFASG
jgi:hypothetical protein